MALFVKKFQNFTKNKIQNPIFFKTKKGNDKNKFESKRRGEKKNGKNHVQRVQCYECKGYRHIAQECLNKNKKEKVFTITTWDDMSESKDSDDEEGESGGDDINFITFVASVNFHGSVSKCDGENFQKSSSFTESKLMLESELAKLKSKLNKSNVSFKKYSTSSRLLGNILASQRTTSDHIGIWYHGNAST